jgi:hypothetical protein
VACTICIKFGQLASPAAKRAPWLIALVIGIA